MTVEKAVADHYASGDLMARIEAALAAQGITGRRLEPADLAPVDEFHIGGREATLAFARRLDPPAAGHLLDIGCGLGGASRHIAAAYDCRVTGIDLTPDYVAAARALAQRTGLGDATAYDTGDATALPYGDAAFDGAYTIHAAMNIADKAQLYREAHRAIKPGGRFGIYDVMAAGGGAIHFPVPWASGAGTSFLATPAETRVLVTAAGFEVVSFRDLSDVALDFFRRLAARAEADGPAPLGLHLLMGADFAQKVANMALNLRQGRVLPGELICRKP